MQERSPAKRAFVIVNTRSGSHDSEAIAAALDRNLPPSGIEWEWVLREKGQSRRDLTRTALEAGHRLIVAAGGDGTVARCADVVSEYPDAVLGVLPTGTGNLLARELGVPLSIDEAARVVAVGSTRSIDAMEVNDDRLCFSHISMGTYSRIASMGTPDEKKHLGRLAYLRHLWAEIKGRRTWTFLVTHDGETKRCTASLILVANVGAVGIPGMRWGEGIAPDDGALDVCVVRARTPGQYLSLAAAAVTNRLAEANGIEHISITRSVRVEASGEDLPIRGDGKTIGHGAATIRVIPGAINVLVGALGTDGEEGASPVPDAAESSS